MEKGPSSLGMLSKLKKLHFRIEFSTGHKPNIPWAGRVQEAGKLPNVKCLALRCLLVMGMENVATIVDSIKQLKYLEIDDAFDIEGGIKDVINALQKKAPSITFTNLPKLVI